MKTQALAILLTSLLPFACQSETYSPEKGQASSRTQKATGSSSSPFVLPPSVQVNEVSGGSIQTLKPDAELEGSGEVVSEEAPKDEGVIISCMGVTGGANFVIRDSQDPARKQGFLTKGKTSKEFSCREVEKGERYPDQSYGLWTCDETSVEKDALHIEISYHGFTGWKVGVVLQDQEGSPTPVLKERLGCPLTPYDSL